MVIESQSPDLIIFHKTLGLPWWFLHLDVKRLTGKLNPLAKEFWRMPELNIPFMKATMGQKLISNGSRSEISSKVCSFWLVLPCYQHKNLLQNWMLKKAVSMGSLQPILCIYKETTAVFLKSFSAGWPNFRQWYANAPQNLCWSHRFLLSDKGELLRQETWAYFQRSPDRRHAQG